MEPQAEWQNQLDQALRKEKEKQSDDESEDQKYFDDDFLQNEPEGHEQLRGSIGERKSSLSDEALDHDGIFLDFDAEPKVEGPKPIKVDLDQCKKYAKNMNEKSQITASKTEKIEIDQVNQVIQMSKTQNMSLTINDASESTTSLCVDIAKQMVQTIDHSQPAQKLFSTTQFQNISINQEIGKPVPTANQITSIDPVIRLDGEEEKKEEKPPAVEKVPEAEPPAVQTATSKKKQAKQDKKKEAKQNAKLKAQQQKQ